MKKQRVSILSLFLAIVLIPLLSGNIFSMDNESIYGHISYVDVGAKVIREDKTEHKAVVNLPVVPGDQIITGEKGRCELQFDNGTVIRLDKDSRLMVTTVLAPSLTSRWKITTLQLMRGQVCSMNQSYNEEMFQIITPNAALDFKRSSTTYIQVAENGDTFIFPERGKLKLMYGENVQSLNTETLRADRGYRVTADHKLWLNEGKRDLEFVAWNQYVNRNFRDLHYGVNKVPKKIYRYSKGLVYWAEKWSSLVGEWIYDELFGYVWKPADEMFAFRARPFFHADFVRVNGKLFLVPQQPWGWIPAHMGNWVWLTKRGWVWIPGNSFAGLSQTSNFDQYFFPTLGYWMNRCYGGFDLYYTFRDYGIHAWRDAYRNKFNASVKNPLLKEAPKEIRQLIRTINHASTAVVKERLGTESPSSVIDRGKIRPLLESTKPGMGTNQNTKPITPVQIKGDKLSHSQVTAPGTPTVTGKSAPVKNIESLKGLKDNSPRHGEIGARDWNPDSRWAARKGYEIQYSSKTNEVLCPTLGISSKTITNPGRTFLRTGSIYHQTGSGSGSQTGTSVSSVGSTSTSGISRTGGGPISDTGSHHGSGKEKQ